MGPIESAGSGGDDTSAGGSGTLPGSGDCATSASVRVQYKVLRSDSVIQFQLRFYNESATPLGLDHYELDYYFSNEEDSAWNAYVDDAGTDGGADGYIALQGVTAVASIPLVPAAAGATHALRITIDSTTPLEPEDEGLMSIRLEPTIYDPPHQTQADDYSFDAAKTELADWDRVTVTADGELVWGCVP
jgi:hypothetical protein